MPIYVEDLLERIPPETESLVEQTRQRMANRIRDQVRKATGLSLSRLNASRMSKSHSQLDTIAVPIELKAGKPRTVADVAFDDRLWLLPLVGPHRNDLENLSRTLPVLKGLITTIAMAPRHDAFITAVQGDITQPVRDTTKYLLEILDQANPVKKILEVDDDVLGVYRYGLPRRPGETCWQGNIEIYWGMIGLIAGLLGVGVEALTCVVLAHELAHAYTHLGADIDGQRWDTSVFYECDHHLVEGLAQYYTWLACTTMENHVPGVFKAYESLLSKQPSAYHAHENWISKFTPEIMRMGLIEARRMKEKRLDGFNKILDSANSRLRNTVVAIESSH